jgi:hypothetical protein
MSEQSWNDFEKTGKVSDYLNYKLSNDNTFEQKVNEGEIKPALPKDVGKDGKDEFPKLHLPVDFGGENADKNEGNRP